MSPMRAAGSSSVRGVEKFDVDAAGTAEAFSRHRFTDTYAAMHDDIEWTLVGDRVIAGKPAVIAECENSAAYLAGVTTSFEKFRVIAAGETVAVESRATYVDAAGDRSEVASCDIYDFEDRLITAITSFTSFTAELG